MKWGVSTFVTCALSAQRYWHSAADARGSAATDASDSCNAGLGSALLNAEQFFGGRSQVDFLAIEHGCWPDSWLVIPDSVCTSPPNIASAGCPAFGRGCPFGRAPLAAASKLNQGAV